MTMPGFAKIPNRILDYIRSGRMTPLDVGVYTFLNLCCSWGTGIYSGTALGIAMQFDDARLQSAIQKSLHRLRSVKLINYHHDQGKRGRYDILIHGFEPSLGAQSGRWLNAWKHGDRCIPEYQSGAVEAPEGAVEGAPEDPVERRDVGAPEAAHIPDYPDSIPDGTDETDVQTRAQASARARAHAVSPEENTGGTPVPHGEFPVPPQGDTPWTQKDVSRCIEKWNFACDVPAKEEDFPIMLSLLASKGEQYPVPLLKDIIVWTWLISYYGSKKLFASSTEFCQELNDVYAAFNKYAAKSTPRKFRKMLDEEEQLHFRIKYDADTSASKHGNSDDEGIEDCAEDGAEQDSDVWVRDDNKDPKPTGISDDDEEF